MDTEEFIELEFLKTMAMCNPDNYVSDGNGGITFVENIMSEDEREAWEYETFLKEHPELRIVEDVGF